MCHYLFNRCKYGDMVELYLTVIFESKNYVIHYIRHSLTE